MSQELTIDDQILTWLHYWGITETIEIEEEAKDIVLAGLSGADTTRVAIEDGGLVIEAGYE